MIQELLRIPELPSALKKNSEKRFRSACVLTSEANLQQIEEKERKKRKEEEACMRQRKEHDERARQRLRNDYLLKGSSRRDVLRMNRHADRKRRHQLRPAKGRERCKFSPADRKKRRHKVKLQRGGASICILDSCCPP